MKRISFAIAAIGATLISASTSSAQSNKAISLGISAGATIPVGDLGDLYSTGYNGTASLMFRSIGSPLGLRIDGMYNRMRVRDDVIGLGDIESISIAGVNGNLVYNLSGTGITPYLIGGGGVYWPQTHGNGLDSNAEAKLGLNGGVGAAFPLSGFNTFIEARFHHVFTDTAEGANHQSTNFIPVTFGISF
jgi:hypothetical protein